MCFVKPSCNKNGAMSFQGKAAECILTTVRDGKMEIPPYLPGLSLEGRVLS
jgi:hypothetical protein